MDGGPQAAAVGGQPRRLGYAAGWRLVRTVPEFFARNAFGAGARYAALGGGPDSCARTWPG